VVDAEKEKPSVFLLVFAKKGVSVRFNGHFPGGPELAGTRTSPFWILLELMLMPLPL